MPRAKTPKPEGTKPKEEEFSPTSALIRRDERDSYLQSKFLASNKEKCEKFLNLENTVNRPTWDPVEHSDNTGKKVLSNDMPLYTKVEFKNGQFVLPPANVALSDELVFLVDGAGVPQRQKGTMWPVDYDNNGDIRQNRVPAGKPPILWMHGLPTLPVRGKFYALVGGDAARNTKVPWLFAPKNNDHLKTYKGYTAGLFIASTHVFPANEEGHPTPLTTEYQLHGRGDNCGGNQITVPADYQDLAVYIDHDSWSLAPIWTISGFNVSCSPNAKVMLTQNACSKYSLNLDWTSAKLAPYVNDRNPYLLTDAELADRVFPDAPAPTEYHSEAEHQATATMDIAAHQAPAPASAADNSTFLRKAFEDFGPYLDALAQIPSQQKELRKLLKENETDIAKYYQALPARIAETDLKLRDAAVELSKQVHDLEATNAYAGQEAALYFERTFDKTVMTFDSTGHPTGGYEDITKPDQPATQGDKRPAAPADSGSPNKRVKTEEDISASFALVKEPSPTLAELNQRDESDNSQPADKNSTTAPKDDAISIRATKLSEMAADPTIRFLWSQRRFTDIQFDRMPPSQRYLWGSKLLTIHDPHIDYLLERRENLEDLHQALLQHVPSADEKNKRDELDQQYDALLTNPTFRKDWLDNPHDVPYEVLADLSSLSDDVDTRASPDDVHNAKVEYVRDAVARLRRQPPTHWTKAQPRPFPREVDKLDRETEEAAYEQRQADLGEAIGRPDIVEIIRRPRAAYTDLPILPIPDVQLQLQAYIDAARRERLVFPPEVISRKLLFATLGLLINQQALRAHQVVTL
ncbi:hypothetical protein PoHVEF18_009341 [Penicillium ochrochloron]